MDRIGHGAFCPWQGAICKGAAQWGSAGRRRDLCWWHGACWEGAHARKRSHELPGAPRSGGSSGANLPSGWLCSRERWRRSRWRKRTGFTIRFSIREAVSQREDPPPGPIPSPGMRVSRNDEPLAGAGILRCRFPRKRRWSEMAAKPKTPPPGHPPDEPRIAEPPNDGFPADEDVSTPPPGSDQSEETREE